nr:MAG TPA: hypothetical protein [Caudoviricetes sp.]
MCIFPPCILFKYALYCICGDKDSRPRVSGTGSGLTHRHIQPDRRRKVRKTLC